MYKLKILDLIMLVHGLKVFFYFFYVKKVILYRWLIFGSSEQLKVNFQTVVNFWVI